MRSIVMVAALMMGTAALVISPGEVAAQLTSEEAEALTKCQDAVAKSGQKFLNAKLKLIEQCGTERVEASLQCAAGNLACPDLLDAAEATCAKNFEKVAPASTKFVDAVLKACEPVETLIFDGSDPLAYQGLIAFISSIVGANIVVTNLTELAGALCVGKELLVDAAAVLEVPAGFQNPFELIGIPLDERCIVSITDPV
jgi:hypothetical protein